jgi:hypothetical protein
VLGVLLASCGGTQESQRNAWPTGPHDGALREITYINPLPGSQKWRLIGKCMTAEAARHGIKVRTIGPPGGDVNVQAMQNMLSQAIAVKTQAIATWSNVGAQAFDAQFAKARAQGGAIATIISPGATHNQNFQVGSDATAQVHALAGAIARLRGNRQLGIIVQDPDAPRDKQIVAQLKSELAAHPNVKFVDARYDYGRFSEDGRLAATMLTVHPGIDTLWVYNGYPGTAVALRERRVAGKVALLQNAGDYPDAAVRNMREGVVTMVGAIDVCGMGRTIVQGLRRVWAGKRVQANYGQQIRWVGPDEYVRLRKKGWL